VEVLVEVVLEMIQEQFTLETHLPLVLLKEIQEVLLVLAQTYMDQELVEEQVVLELMEQVLLVVMAEQVHQIQLQEVQ
jgi:hypothetical protein